MNHRFHITRFGWWQVILRWAWTQGALLGFSLVPPLILRESDLGQIAMARIIAQIRGAVFGARWDWWLVLTYESFLVAYFIMSLVPLCRFYAAFHVILTRTWHKQTSLRYTTLPTQCLSCRVPRTDRSRWLVHPQILSGSLPWIFVINKSAQAQIWDRLLHPQSLEEPRASTLVLGGTRLLNTVPRQSKSITFLESSQNVQLTRFLRAKSISQSFLLNVLLEFI